MTPQLLVISYRSNSAVFTGSCATILRISFRFSLGLNHSYGCNLNTLTPSYIEPAFTYADLARNQLKSLIKILATESLLDQRFPDLFICLLIINSVLMACTSLAFSHCKGVTVSFFLNKNLKGLPKTSPDFTDTNHPYFSNHSVYYSTYYHYVTIYTKKTLFVGHIFLNLRSTEITYHYDTTT